MSIDAEVMEWINAHGRGVSTLPVEPEHYVSVAPGFDVRLPPTEPLPATLQLNTLAGLAAYLAENRDGLDPDSLALHVSTPCAVDLIGPLQGRHQQRPRYAAAVYLGQIQSLDGAWHPVEQVLEDLLHAFDPTEDRSNLIEMLSRVRQESEVQQVDDGMSQTVTTQQGKVTVGRDKLPSPAYLAPRLTFAGEVEVVAHPYTVRVKSSTAGVGVLVRFLEADGGAWRLDQKYLLRDALRKLKVEESIPILV